MAYGPATVVEYFRVAYFKIIDSIVQQLSERVIDSAGIERYCRLEKMLLHYHVDEVAFEYPELSAKDSLFRLSWTCSKLYRT